MMEVPAFRQAADAVGQWLENRTDGRLKPLAIGSDSDFACGWSFVIEISGVACEISVLLPSTFPFARPRIALTAPDHSFHWPNVDTAWPHVEGFGLLCLTRREIDASDPVGSVDAALGDAFRLIEINSQSVDLEEFRREFVPYWNRTCDVPAFYTLLQPEAPSRRSRAWLGKGLAVIGDEAEVNQWLINAGVAQRNLVDGLFVWLEYPPAPSDFPRNIDGLRRWLRQASPSAAELFEATTFSGDAFPIVFGARAGTSGVGLGGIVIRTPQRVRVNGFRPGKEPLALANRERLSKATSTNRKVVRIDASWIHGRTHDADQPTLYNSTVAVVGCGSLGSHVAERLAQSGVGFFHLIDPETLTSANIGRHVLGVDEIDKCKAVALAASLRRRFPHLHGFEAHPVQWQDCDEPTLSALAKCDLVISAVGDAGAERALNDWQLARNGTPPIIYCWLEERACVGHGLLIRSPASCLQCLLHRDGSTRLRETVWDAARPDIPEPACGEDFQPYGAADLAHTEAVVAELAIRTLVGKLQGNVQYSYCTSTDRLEELGGRWSEYHLASRPSSFADALVLRRPAPVDERCSICQRK